MTGRRGVRLALVAAASLLSHLQGAWAPALDYHAHRQVNTAAIARNYHRHGLEFLSPRIDWEGGYRGRAATEFPLYMWLTGLFWPIGALGDIWGRLLSILFSAMTAVYLYLYIEREAGPDPALYGSLLFSCIPLEVYFGRTIQPEALALFSTIGALYHWNSSLQPPRRWGHWLAAVLFAFLAISHKLPYAYVLLPMAWLAWERLGRSSLVDPRSLSAFPLIVGGVAAWYLHASSGVYVVPSHPGEFLKILDYGRLPKYVQFQFLSRFPELAATYGGSILLVVGARELVFRRKRAFFGVWFSAIALHLVAGGRYTFSHEYTSLPFTLINAAFMGVGLELALRGLARQSESVRPWARAGLALLVLSIPVHAGLRIRHWYGQNFPFLKNAGAAADAVSAPDDLFLCNQRASSVYLYYLDRRGWSWDLAEAGEARIGEVEDKIKAGARYFMTAKDGAFKDRDGFYSRWFYSRFSVVYDEGGILIFRLKA